jgi:Holliday junction resolvasome RuvABC endonuclease subunit
MLFIGIDPGMSGGIAVVTVERASAWKMPATERDLVVLLAQITQPQQHYIEQHDAVEFRRPKVHAVIERVWSSPQMGVSSAFKFGVNVGWCRMALAALKIPFDEVLPTAWQKAMGCRVGTSRAAGGPVGGDKNITKRRAQALFPEMTITHANADALLIAEFCRRQYSGAARTAKPAQQEMFNGKEDEGTEEGREEGREPGRVAEPAEEAGRDEESQGATQAATGDAARDGAAEDRAHRERRPRLRRRA